MFLCDFFPHIDKHYKIAFTVQWKIRVNTSERWLVGFFPLSHQLELHTAPWVDGSVGRPLFTPTAQCAPPHFGLLPGLFAASPSQIRLFFVAFQCRYTGMSHRNNENMLSTRSPPCITMAKSIKSSKAHWPWSNRITWIRSFWTTRTLQHRKPEEYCFLSSLETDHSSLLIREQTESYWIQDFIQCKVM